MRLYLKLLTITISFLYFIFPVRTHAGSEASDYYRDVKQGWWWYRNPPKEEKKEEPKPEKKLRRIPSMKDYNQEQLWKMHPDDFQELLMDFQKKAVMQLTRRASTNIWSCRR